MSSATFGLLSKTLGGRVFGQTSEIGRETKGDPGRPKETKGDQGRPRATRGDQGEPTATMFSGRRHNKPIKTHAIFLSKFVENLFFGAQKAI